jgi:hypothetical protein
MKKAATIRFWLELGLAAVSGVLFFVTLFRPNWIELVFGVEPDGGDGSLEWLIVAVLAAATVALLALARVEWRKMRAAAAPARNS